MTKSNYSKIISLTTTVLVILLGIMFIVCCAHLYFTGGDQPYSRERAGKYLLVLAIPSFVTLASVITGIVYNLKTGENDVENTARTNSELLNSFASRYDFSSFPDDVRAAVNNERSKRKILKTVAYCISAVLMLIAVIYLTLVAKYTIENLNGDVILSLAIALPLTVIAIAIHIPVAYTVEKSSKRELEMHKESIKLNGAPKLAEKKQENDRFNAVKYVILGVAVLLIVLGIINGGMADVLNKAVKICTECIGLG